MESDRKNWVQIAQYAECHGTILVIDILLNSTNLMHLSMIFRDLARKRFFTTL